MTPTTIKTFTTPPEGSTNETDVSQAVPPANNTAGWASIDPQDDGGVSGWMPARLGIKEVMTTISQPSKRG